MAGLTKDSPLPTEILLHQQSHRLEMAFSDGKRFIYPFEFLRVMSPSAEVRGHGPGQETLQVGKRDVEISALEPVGNYALQPTFSDGHATGIYSWDYLYDIGVNHDTLWADYLKRLAAASASRDAAGAGTAPAATTPAAPAMGAHKAISPARAPEAAAKVAPLGTRHKL